METKKSKVFTRKLIAWTLSIVMAVSGFFGVAFSAQAYQKGGYNDNNVASNLLAWVDATDDQTLEALLDLADDFLANMDWDDLNETTSKIDIDSIKSNIPSTFVGLEIIIDQLPYVKVHAETKGAAALAANVNVTIDGYVRSVDDIIKILFQLGDAMKNDIKPAANTLKSFIDITEIVKLNFDVFGNYFHNSNSPGTAGYRDSTGSFRGNNSAKFILKGLLKWILVDNYNNNDNSNLIHDLLYGTSDLLPGMLNLYDSLAGTLGLDEWAKDDDGHATYQVGNGIVYNLLKTLIVKNVPYYKQTYPNRDFLQEEGGWVYDTEAYNVANYYLQKWSFQITYPERVDYTGSGLKDGDDLITGYHEDTSTRRFAAAKAAGEITAVSDGIAQINSAYATSNGWDPNLYYSTEDGYVGNVLIARYGNTTFAINSSDTIHSIVMRALPVAWKTALKATVQLLHVNYNGHDVRGTNFDNGFYYWMSDNNGGWNRTNWTANYTQANIQGYAQYVYETYTYTENNTVKHMFEDATDAYNYIKETVTYNKTRMAKNDKYNWRDIDVTILFNEIRYSPLADKGFGVQTGPLNLYFSQTGCPSIIEFFDNTFDSTGTIIGQVDDALVQAMSDLFPTSTNIGATTYDQATDTYGVTPATLTGLQTCATETVSDVVSTLITDAGKVFAYAADATDANILNPYYAVHGKQAITEANLETAIIPFAIAALKQWNLTASVLDSDWDKVCDIESAAVVALSEYLKYAYPDRDYSDYYTYAQEDVTVDGNVVATHKYIVAKNNEHLLEDVIVPMAGDALAFVLDAAGVPVYVQTDNNTAKTEVNGGTVLDPNNYTFFGKGTGLNNLIWQTLNGVACYFAVDKGIAGLANLQGQVTKTNSIWTNLDNIINAYFPSFSQFLPLATTNNQFDSQKLIWTQLVEGVADVANAQFLTTALTYIGNLLVCTPIATTTVLKVAIFDILKPVVNKLLGARVSGGGDLITQTASTTNPIDNFLKRDYVIDTAVTNLITNLYNVLTTSNAVGQSTYDAVCFGLRALHFIPKVDDNRIGGVTATLNEHAVTDTNVSVKMGVRNESWGFTSFYKDSSGTIHQRGRSNANILNYKVYNAVTGAQVNNFTITADDGFNSTGALNAEQYTRVILSGTATNNTLYRVVVNYTMNTYDTLGSSEPTYTYNAKAVDYLFVGNTLNDAWSAAFSGNNVSTTANDALFTIYTSGNYGYRTPNFVGVGTNAGNAAYKYLVTYSNTSSGTTMHNTYATVAANTADYYDYEGNRSTAADSSSAYVAVDKDGKVLMADGTKADAATLVAESEDVMGYISHDGETYTAVTVDTNAIGDYKLGTPLAGVYLDDADVTIPAATKDDDNNTIKSETDVRFFSSDSQSGLSVDYNPMNLRTSTGYSFKVTVASGDIDNLYGTLKDNAKGLSTHYDTSDSNVSPASLGDALQTTIADGINASNCAVIDQDLKAANETLLDEAIEARTDEVDDVIFYVIDARKNRSNVNYNSPALYEKSVDMAQEAEELLVWKAQQVDAVDDAGQPTKKDKRDANGDVIYDYYSFAPSIKLKEAARLFNEIYDPQAVKKTYGDATTGKVAIAEVEHATSVCDAYDAPVVATANDYTDFTVTKTATKDHVFPYSTKSGDDKQYDLVDTYTVKATSAVPVKYGALDDQNNLVNTGSTVYTADSWKAYVDALGETIDAINNHKTVQELYDARCHLVMAENNLEEGEGAEGITISGTVYMAQNATATQGTFGARDINFKVNGEYVLDGEGNNAATSSEAGHYGEFEITVPEGTTAITITSDSTVDRTVTLSGTQDITNADIKVVTIDFNKDNKINGLDSGTMKKGLGKTDYKHFDLNNDGKINALDTGAAKKLVNKTVSYSAQALD